MGCMSSSHRSPPSPAMVSTCSQVEGKRVRPETPPPEISESHASSSALLTPPTPTKKARNSPSNGECSASSPDASFSPPRPLTPPDSHLRVGCTGVNEADAELPPTPTRASRHTEAEDDPLGPDIGYISSSSTSRSAEEGDEVESEPAHLILDAGLSSLASSPSPASSISDNEYRIDFGPEQYRGCTINELPHGYRKEIGNDEKLLAHAKGLREALTAWASKWTFTHGFHKGKRLEDVPISYINRFVIGIKKHESLWHKDLYVALKFHLPVRRPEQPGEKYVLTFGRNKGCRLDGLPPEEYVARSYINWMKDEGIPLQSDWEDLADGIVYYQCQELAEFVRDHPEAPTYTFPAYPHRYDDCKGMQITDIPEEEIRHIVERGIHEEEDAGGGYQYPGMKEAVGYWFLLYECNRWNWRTTVRWEWGRMRYYPMDLGKNLFPSTEVEQGVYQGLRDE
ncbi:hypothetical protein BU26DRAFT_505422 [Trematosphaeria pertusa]|uniref:Uncharacterized protein n=1 Tax=Trematosphaeria pertusa TaxID=390896 RepID=A0A6A6IIJ7_9PLEO|nr:uncharacterized protein BU26DRAFT_505422 [Trematosphaeria pertusa]KAF2249383.1 hypothetical protein BU26DRAFT_505422 [Trematosphaeria pertusa]